MKTREEKIEYLKNYYLKNKERLKANMREAYQRDKTPYLQRSKEQKVRLGAEYSNYQKGYRLRNKERLNAYVLNRLHTNPVVKLRHTLRGRFRKLVTGKHKTNSVLNLLGCTVEDLKIHLEKQWHSGMAWDNWGTLWHIDHIKPCSSFDLTDPQQQAACWNYSNLRPLLAIDNLRKGAKII